MLSKPTLECWITSIGTDTNKFGESIEGTRVKSLCSPVKLTSGEQSTSVRADSSASRGNANEIISDARLLFSPKQKIDFGYKVEVAGITLKVTEIFPRFDVLGKLDHYQVDANIWA